MDVLDYISQLDAPVRKALLTWAQRVDEELLPRCHIVHVSHGEELVSMFDRCAYVYILCKGRIRITTRAVSGNNFTVDEFDAPTVFGEMELLAGNTSTLGSLVALSDCEFIAAPQKDYLAWLKSDPEALLSRSRWVVRNLLRQMDSTRSFMGWKSTKRLMFVLFHCCRADNASEQRVISLSRTELAERSGVSTKTVSRGLAELEAQHMLQRRGRKIVIDRNAYERMRNEIQQEVVSEAPADAKKEEP